MTNTEIDTAAILIDVSDALSDCERIRSAWTSVRNELFEQGDRSGADAAYRTASDWKARTLTVLRVYSEMLDAEL